MHVARPGETDGPQAKHLIDSQAPERRPHGSSATPPMATGRSGPSSPSVQVEVLAQVPEGKVTEDVLGKQDFAIDLAAGTVTCPDGHTVPIWTSPNGFRRRELHRARCAETAR